MTNLQQMIDIQLWIITHGYVKGNQSFFLL